MQIVIGRASAMAVARDSPLEEGCHRRRRALDNCKLRGPAELPGVIADEEEEAIDRSWELRRQKWAVQMVMVTVLSIILDTSTPTIFQYPITILMTLSPGDVNFFKIGARVDDGAAQLREQGELL